ncbi:MAG: hypothetical protein ABJA61_08405 [Caldimonas sp.]
MTLPTARVEVLVWVLIYGGLIGASLGIALQRGGAPYGWFMLVAGALAVLIGILLIWLRSRMREPAP